MASRESFFLRVNGRGARVHAEPDTPLVFVLRNQLGILSPKLGCGLGQCGACAVLLDGRVELSCVLSVESSAGRAIETLEGFAEDGELHPLQQAFLDENAAQCGFCLSGILVRVKALTAGGEVLSEGALKEALASHLCRCGAQPRMLRAVLRLLAASAR